MQVTFPACLTAQQRAALHAAAEESGLPHQSSGTAAERRIAVGGGDTEVSNLLMMSQESCAKYFPDGADSLLLVSLPTVGWARRLI